MSTENYFQTFRSALARIYNKNCKVVGADFLVNQYHLLTFRIFGFPQGHDLGVWANDELLDAQATHSIQIEAIKVPRYQIELGFSDSPVWDKPLQGVVGMAVPAEKKREGVKSAFRMPITVLVETGDFLHQAMQQKPINSSRSFNRVQEIKVRELEKRFAILEIDYQAVYNQLNETLDAEFKNKIQLKLKRIEQEMNDVFGELKMVG